MTLSMSSTELEYQKGLSFIQIGRVEDAYIIFSHLKNQFPDHASISERLGYCCAVRENWLEAEKHFRHASKLAPHNSEILNNLGCVLQKQTKWSDAAECFSSALEKSPSHTQALRNLGLCLQKQGKDSLAIAKYRQLLKLTPQDLDIAYQVAELLFKANQFQQAHKDYTSLSLQALSLKSPYYIKAQLKLALLDFALQAQEEAAQRIQALNLGSSDIEHSFSLWAKSALAEERYGDASIGYGLLSKLYPESSEYRAAWLINLYVSRPVSEEMIYLIEKAMDDFPALSIFPKTLAIIYGQAGLPQKALAAAQRYIDVSPDDPAAYVSYASLLRQHQKSLQKNPKSDTSHDLDDVIEKYVRAAWLCGDDIQKQQKVIQSLIETKEPDLVRLCLDALLRQDQVNGSHVPSLFMNMIRGYLAQEEKRTEEAHEYFLKVCNDVPNFSFAWSELAETLYQLCRADEAELAAETAVRVKPNDSQALIRYGLILSNCGKTDAGIACCERAQHINPQDPDIQFALGLQYLRNRQWDKGWPLYDARLRFRHRNPIDIPPVPRWDGIPFDNLELIICPEQGLGDIIQFSRFIPLVAEKASRVIVVMRPALVHLFEPLQKIYPHIDIVAEHARFHIAKDHARWMPIMDLPRLLNISEDHFADPVPYIKADPLKVQLWKDYLSKMNLGNRIKIGLVWQGNPQNGVDAGRSIPLHFFEPLSQLEKICLISLQKNHGLEQIETISFKDRIHFPEEHFDTGPNAFADTLGMMANLDLVITSDTSMAHLAGASGFPVWVGLKYAAEWRWQMDREDSPWYPSMRLFRQQRIGDWESVISQMINALKSQK